MRRRANKAKNSQKGMALILALMIVFVLSAAAAGMIFATQTDVWSTANYNFLTQSRYAAEAGAQAATNWIIAYPSWPATTPCASVTCTTYPISKTGTPTQSVFLTTDPALTGSQYFPIGSGVQTAFNTYIGGVCGTSSFTSISSASCVVTATLMSVPGVAGADQWPEAQWQITSTGTIGSPAAFRPVSVQVVETLEYLPQQTFQAAFTYGMFSTATGCNSLTINGSQTVNSYNSGWAPNSSTYTPVQYSSGIAGSSGNVGSNGSVTVVGSGTIKGTVSSPDTTTGSCGSGGDALVYTGSGQINGVSGSSYVPTKLGASLTYTAPTIPNIAMTGVAATCTGAACTFPTTPPGQNVTCNGVSCVVNPGTYGDVLFNGSNTYTLDPGTTAAGTYTYNVTSFINNGSGSLKLKVVPGQNIVINVTTGQGANSAAPIVINGSGATSGSPQTPEQLEINYGGTGTVTVNGSGSTEALIYAPNAPVTLNGSGDFSGAVVGGKLVYNGSGPVHYDLAAAAYQVPTGSGTRHYLTSFTWNKY